MAIGARAPCHAPTRPGCHLGEWEPVRNRRARHPLVPPFEASRHCWVRPFAVFCRLPPAEAGRARPAKPGRPCKGLARDAALGLCPAFWEKRPPPAAQAMQRAPDQGVAREETGKCEDDPLARGKPALPSALSEPAQTASRPAQGARPRQRKGRPSIFNAARGRGRSRPLLDPVSRSPVHRERGGEGEKFMAPPVARALRPRRARGGRAATSTANGLSSAEKMSLPAARRPAAGHDRDATARWGEADIGPAITRSDDGGLHRGHLRQSRKRAIWPIRPASPTAGPDPRWPAGRCNRFGTLPREFALEASVSAHDGPGGPMDGPIAKRLTVSSCKSHP